MKKRFIPYLILIISFLAIACKDKNANRIGNGTFEANEIIVSAQSDGEILEWQLTEGTKLNAGEQVGLIDSTMLHLQKISLQENAKSVSASAPNVRTQTAALRDKLNELKQDRSRIKNLVEADVAPQKQLDDINSAIAQLESQIQAQSSILDKNNARISAQGSSIHAQIAQLNERIAHCRVSAPISGIVLQSFVHKGELTGTGRPLFSMAAMDTLTLRAYVAASDLSQLHLGEAVQARVDHGKGEMKSYTGVLTWIASKSEFTPKAVQTKDERDNAVYAVKVAVPNKEGTLRIGMYAELIAP